MSIEAEALKIVEAALGTEDPVARAALIAERCGDRDALKARVQNLIERENTEFRLLPTESFVRPLAVVDDIPERIGPYRVTGEIARGGMGAVVKAERDDGVFQQTVAIKLIRGDLASPRAKARFAAERRILGRLRHPGIVRIIDGGETRNRAWLAMDYIDGLRIDEALRAADIDTRLDAFEAVCEAVAYAHRQFVVHADIKPSNVLCSADGAIHLLDFGIARLTAAIDVEEEGDPYPLTKEYAAPERGVGTIPTIASDIFSLGVLLLAMLRKPRQSEGPPSVPGSRLPSGVLDGDLAVIAACMLAEQPEARYSDVPALLDDIRRYRGFWPVHAHKTGDWRYRATHFIRRNRRPLVVASAVAFALVGTSVLTTIQYVRAERARSEADARFSEVRALARSMLFDLYDRLADAPGTVAVRAQLAETARTYLDRLGALPGAPADLRLDIARSYRRLATIQGLSGTANLGRPQEAVVSLGKAERLLAPLVRADPDNPDILVEQGWIALARWTLASDGKGTQFNEEAARAFARARAIRPENAEARLGAWLAARNEAFDLVNADSNADARALATQTLASVRAARMPRPIQTEAKMLEVSLLNRIGDATYYGGDMVGGLAMYREAEALILGELAKAPSVRWEERLAEAEYNIAGTLGEMGRETDALAVTQRGLDRLNRVLATGDDAALQFRRIILLGEKAILLRSLGRAAEAANVSAEQIALREKRLAGQPDDVTRRRDLLVALAAHAELLGDVRQPAEACTAARRGKALIDAMARAGDLSERDRRIEYPRLKAAQDRYCG